MLSIMFLIVISFLDNSLKLRKQSKQLLEIAKTGVEKAIEENEERATAWIDQQLNLLGIKLS